MYKLLIAVFVAVTVRANSLLPDGASFPFWECQTDYLTTYHVAQNHPNASDVNPGTEEQPWETINKAAQELMPGERVLIHAGVYRERVVPARGGTGPERMITYEAVPGEEVVLKGSVVWDGPVEQSDYFNVWVRNNPLNIGRTIWKISFSGILFEGANPFSLQNYPRRKMEIRGEKEAAGAGTNLALPSMDHRRGQFFVDGIPLRQVDGEGVEALRELMRPSGGFWVEDNGMTVHFTLPGFADPKDHEIELTVREQVFAPEKRHLNYIRVKGFRMLHAGNGIPIPAPQRGLLSANAGHHWIIEDCEVAHANTIGIDVGGGYWNYPLGEFQGGHIIRRNHIHDNGLCGLAGWHNRPNEFMLIEDNLFERNATLPVTKRYESAAVKLHGVQNSLIRRNVFLNTARSASLWLDAEVYNTRITQNLFYGLSAGDLRGAFGHVFVEISYGPCLVDNNIMVGSEVHGFYQHDAERCVLIQNLIAGIDGCAVFMRHGDMNRRMRPWDQSNPPLEDEHRVFGNMIVNSGRYIHFPNATSRADFNLYSQASETNLFTDRAAYAVELQGQPWPYVDFAAWKKSGQDRQSRMGSFRVSFDPERLELRVFGYGLEKLPEWPMEMVALPAFITPGKWMVVLKDGERVLDRNFPAPSIGNLKDLLSEDLLGKVRDPGRFAVGPLLNPHLNGKPFNVDPRKCEMVK